MSECTKQRRRQRGFSIVELLVALGVFGVMIGLIITVVWDNLSINRLSQEYFRAQLLAEEGIEAVIAQQRGDFYSLQPGTYGLVNDNGYWELTGSPDVVDQYTRTLTIAAVERDGGGQMVASGGTVDGDTVKVVSDVSWSFTPIRNNSVKLERYLTNWQQELAQSCDGSGVAELSQLDLDGNNRINDIQLLNGYAYITTTNQGGTNPDFYVVDISDPGQPQVVGSLELNASGNDIAISQTTAYVATSHDSEELMTIDIQNPSNPQVTGSLDLSTGRDALAVTYQSPYAFLGKERTPGVDGELLTIDPSLPNPQVVAEVNTNDNQNDVTISNGYLLSATAANSGELVMYSIEQTEGLSNVGGYDAAGNADGVSLLVDEQIVFLGRESSSTQELEILRHTDTTLTSLSLLETSATIWDLERLGSLLILGSNRNGGGLLLVDVSDLESPVLIEQLDVGGDVRALARDDASCSIVYGVDAPSNELRIASVIVEAQLTPTPTISITPTPTLAGGATPTVGPTPTPTPTIQPTTTPAPSTCADYCLGVGYTQGTCRQNTQQCGQNSEVYESGGDVYCTGGAQVDTCCCR